MVQLETKNASFRHSALARRLLLSWPMNLSMHPDKLFAAAQRLAQRVTRPAWFGTLHRTHPLSTQWGYDRGLPIDRHYIDGFLTRYQRDLTGPTLEIGDRRYIRRFASPQHAHAVLDIVADGGADIVADLCALDQLPRAEFQSFICIQTLQYVSSVPQALQGAKQLLKPGGVLLATVPAIAGIDRGARGADRWRFSALQTMTWVKEVFGPDANVRVEPMGNALTACAALMGLARQDLSETDLSQQDSDYPVILGIRAVKSAE